MPQHRFSKSLAQHVIQLRASGVAKGAERIITGVVPAEGDRGPRYKLAGEGNKLFLRMNANAYLGLSCDREMIAAEEQAVRA